MKSPLRKTIIYALLRLVLGCGLGLGLAGCAIYKIDVQQGNDVNAEMLSQLKIGMSKDEVLKILGAPLINDPFHKDRWDYYYYLRKGRTGAVQQHSTTLIFEGDALKQFRSSLQQSP